MKPSFTLLETVIATSLLSLISVTIFASYISVLSLYSQMGQNKAVRDELNRAVTKIGSDLASFEMISGYNAEFRARAESISFLAKQNVYDHLKKTKKSSLAYNRYYMSQGKLFRESSLAGEALKQNKKMNKEIMLSEINNLSFRYGTKVENTDIIRWRKSHPQSTELNDLPHFVEITISKVSSGQEHSANAILVLKGSVW